MTTPTGRKSLFYKTFWRKNDGKQSIASLLPESSAAKGSTIKHKSKQHESFTNKLNTYSHYTVDVRHFNSCSFFKDLIIKWAECTYLGLSNEDAMIILTRKILLSLNNSIVFSLRFIQGHTYPFSCHETSNEHHLMDPLTSESDRNATHFLLLKLVIGNQHLCLKFYP